ncbi:MAG TPA: hypothetical protein VF753_21675 [Terriglobales bacterium]
MTTARPVFLKFAAIVFAAILGTSAGLSADLPNPQSLPKVEDVMKHYVDAVGGHDAIFKHQSMTVHEKLDVSAGDKHASLNRAVYYKNGKSHEVLDLPDGGQYQSGYDGKTAWEMSTAGSAALIEGDEAKSKVRDADMYYPARILDYFNSMGVVDIADFEGHTCYHLKGINNWGKPNEHFYDTKTGLLIGYRFNSAWRGGPGDESVVFNDYKSFDGWLIPTRVDHKQPQQTLTEEIGSITFDDVPDSQFTLPDPVKALLAKPH